MSSQIPPLTLILMFLSVSCFSLFPDSLWHSSLVPSSPSPIKLPGGTSVGGILSGPWQTVNQCNYSGLTLSLPLKGDECIRPLIFHLILPHLRPACLPQHPGGSGNKHGARKSAPLRTAGMQRGAIGSEGGGTQTAILSRRAQNVCLFIAIYCSSRVWSLLSLFCFLHGGPLSYQLSVQIGSVLNASRGTSSFFSPSQFRRPI